MNIKKECCHPKRRFANPEFMPFNSLLDTGLRRYDEGTVVSNNTMTHVTLTASTCIRTLIAYLCSNVTE
ncbi:hypothetical protein JYT96_00825 [Gammaproteobacteria bacterium AH-315-C21]|nr:hypothetical protein [Gammaproteobacteria bacterium AH-315-C21]